MFGKVTSIKNQKKSVGRQYKQSNQSLKTFIKPKHKLIKKSEKHIKHSFDLSGSKFRMLNQLLYTSNSKQAYQHFKQHSEDYQVYHEGYQKQSLKWEIKPIQKIINYLMKNKKFKNKQILDLGCGQGKIQQQLEPKGYKIQSYDLVSCKPFIKVADIANLPNQSHSIDVTIFCLSLMGTNYLQFLIEARRVLTIDGQLIVAEVQSRCQNWKQFIQMVQSIGFNLVSQDQSKYFRTIYFKCAQINKNILKKTKDQIKIKSNQLLKPCLYKKR